MAGKASEVRFEEKASTVRRLATQAVLTLAVVGVFERGPIGESKTCNSFDEVQKHYGGYTTNNLDTMAALQSFFDNGGTEAVITRAVHFSDPTNPASATSAAGTLELETDEIAESAGTVLSTIAAPYNIPHGSTLVITVDGGSPATATFNSVAAARTSTGTAPFDLADGDVLTVSIDGGANQNITFATANFADIDAATAEEVCAVINAQIVGAQASVSTGAVRITSDRRGTGSGVNVVAGGAQAAGKLNITAGNVAGSGNVSNGAAVTSAEIKTIVELAVAGCTVTNESSYQRITSNTTGASSSVLVGASSTADDEIGFDNATHSGSEGGAVATLTVDAKTHGAFAGDLTVVIGAASGGQTGTFSLVVKLRGVRVESWDNLSMDPTSAAYIETVINDELNGSDYIVVTDLEAAVDSPDDVPLAGTYGPLTGGADGLGSLADTDFIGGTSSTGSVGMRCFDDTEIDVLTIPQRATSAVHNAMVTYCEITREGLVFPVLDCPAGQSATQIATYVTSTASLYELTEYGAMYWPRVKVVNPNPSVYGSSPNVVIPNSGVICGIMARVDASKVGGVFDQPAGSDAKYLPRNVTGLETNEVKKKPKRDIVTAVNVNPISKEGNDPIFVDGHDCLKTTGNFPSVGQRRGIIFLEQTLKPGLKFLRHRGITEELLESGKNTVTAFMRDLTANGAFASKVPSEAFYIDFGPGINTAASKKAQTIYADFGVATQDPAKYVVVRIGPDNRALEAQFAALAA